MRSRNTDHLDSREINDIECRALAMLREHSMLHPTRSSRKSNKHKPCRRDGHDTRTEKSPERSPNPTNDRLSSDDGPDSSDPDTSARGMDVEQTVSPGRCTTLNRRSARLSALQPCQEQKRKHSFINSLIHSLDFKGLGANHDHWTSSLKMSSKISNCVSTYENIVFTPDTL